MIKLGMIVDKLSVQKEGRKVQIVIRFPKRTDFGRIWKFYNTVIKETEFLSRITPVGRKEEERWFSGLIRKIKKRDKIYLIAEEDKKVIGSCAIERKMKEVSRHVGVYGISILNGYQRLGIGTKLTKHALELARNELGLEIVRLGVYSKNRPAINFYRKMGFKVSGKIPKGIKRGRNYMDEIIAYKILK